MKEIKEITSKLLCTQKDLAELIGISPSSVRKVSGNSSQLKILHRLVLDSLIMHMDICDQNGYQAKEILEQDPINAQLLIETLRIQELQCATQLQKLRNKINQMEDNYVAALKALNYLIYISENNQLLEPEHHDWILHRIEFTKDTIAQNNPTQRVPLEIKLAGLQVELESIQKRLNA